MPNYHLCFTSHKEVLFRDEEDMNHGFNSLCSSLYKTDSACYAYVSMSDHHHGCYRTRAAVELIRAFRESHTKYLNRKYGRKGEMGEAGVYIQEISGIKHFLAAVSYVLKNPPHHGVASSPFEYPYSSANDYFQKELGKNLIPEGLLSYAEIKAVLPRRADFDPSWKMGRNGVFLSASVLDISAVETNFGTAQAFNYYMGRKSGEDWIKEQADENVSSPFTLENIEAPLIHVPNGLSVADMLRNEKSRFRIAAITDLELCSLIDNQILPDYGKRSIYLLTEKEKIEIANTLYKKQSFNADQIKRCLVL